MRLTFRLPKFAILVGICLFLPASVAFSGDFESELRSIRSHIRAMSHGYYTDEDWNAVFLQLDDLAERAKAGGRLEQRIEAGLLKSMVHSDMHGDYVESLRVLEQIREECRRKSVANMTEVYVRQAEVYAKLGDETAIRELLREFKAGPNYDAERYSFSGGQGRKVPLAVVRPGSTASASLTVTAMKRCLESARFAPGKRCPEFQALDTEGVSLQLNDYRGQVVLLDFWLSGWSPWRRELSYLADVYRKYHPYGFEIIGVCLDHDPASAFDVWISERAVWRHATDNRQLPAKFGIYGEAANFLIDQNGIIIGRNLKGSELVDALKKALGM